MKKLISYYDNILSLNYIFNVIKKLKNNLSFVNKPRHMF